jgi:hypothetical protein
MQTILKMPVVKALGPVADCPDAPGKLSVWFPLWLFSLPKVEEQKEKTSSGMMLGSCARPRNGKAEGISV